MGDVALAAALLNEAVAAAPAAAGAWNDLAVAYLAEPTGASIESTARAYESAAIAGRLAATHPAPLFNLALAASRLGLREPSHWRGALKAEQDEQWRREIGRRDVLSTANAIPRFEDVAARVKSVAPADLREHVRALVGAHPQEVREAAFEMLLPEWAHAAAAGERAVAADRTVRLRVAGDTLASNGGDSLLADCVSLTEGPPSRVAAFARAMTYFGEGRRHQRATRFEAALEAFEHSVEAMRGYQAPCMAMANAALAHADYQAHGPGRVVARLGTARDIAERRGYRSLLARIDWILAMAFVSAGEPARAIAAYDQSTAGYSETGETANLCSVARASADLLRVQGEWVSGWPRLSLALRCVAHDRDPVRRYLAYFEASLFAADTQMPRLALAFQEEALAAARERGVAATTAEGLIRRAMLHARIGNAARARSDLAEAERAASGISSPGMAVYLRAWAARVEGELALTTAPARTPVILDEAILALFRSLEPTEVPRVQLLRARAFARVGDRGSAERELVAGLHAIEKTLTKLDRAEQHLAYRDAEWDLVGELSRALFERGQYLESLLRAHYRSGSERESQALCRTQADRTAVYAFVALRDEVLLFACTPAGLVSRKVAVSAASVDRRIQAYRRLLLAGGTADQIAGPAGELFELLFGWAPPPAGSRVVVVPDGTFGLIPFAALVNPATRRYLVEDHDLVVQSLDNPARGPRRATQREALIVAPAVGRPLPRVRDEMANVASAYRDVVVLEGARATADALRRLMPDVRVLHFAGHAKANPSLPWASYLSVTADPLRPQGRLEASEIARWPLSGVDLVVLSACESVSPRTTRGESLVGLAKAFLRAGAGAVVGSLWEVEDDSTSELMTAFHGLARGGASPEAALRQAQLRLMQGTDPSHRLPRNWAGFTVITASR